MSFRRVSTGKDSFGVSHYHYSVIGLPEGIRCEVVPEQADRPKGEWFVAGRRGSGRKAIIRRESKEEAIEKATKWCKLAIASVTVGSRPAKRKAKK